MGSSSSGERSGDSSFVNISSNASFIANRNIVKLPFYFPKSCVIRRKYYQPRDNELQHIAKVLSPTSRDTDQFRGINLLTFAISGLGGIGKTQTASEFVIKYKDEFDAIFFIHADNANRLSEQYAKLAFQLKLLHEKDNPSPQTCKETVKSWLVDPYKVVSHSTNAAPETAYEDITQVHWLMVFNNAEDLEILDQYWPRGGFGSVLVTSRNPLVRSQFFDPVASFELTSLPIDDAASLLKCITGSDQENSSNTEEAARTLATRLEGLPLAISQIGAIISQRTLSIHKFLQTYSRDSDLYEVDSEHGLKSGYEHNLGSVWAFDNLPAGAFSVLCLISMLDSECIQEELLLPISTSNQRPQFPSSEKEYHKCYSELTATSLVEKNLDDGTTRVHRLVQSVTRARIAKVDGALCGIFLDVVTRIASCWPFLNKSYVTGNYGKIDRWSQCAKFYPHVLNLWWIYQELLEKNSVPRLCLDLGELLCEAAQYSLRYYPS